MQKSVVSFVAMMIYFVFVFVFSIAAFNLSNWYLVVAGLTLVSLPTRTKA